MRWSPASCILVALFVPCLTWGQTLVGGACTQNTSTATNTLTVTRTTTLGSLLILFPSEGSDSSTTWTVADTATQSWTQVPASYIGDDGSNSRQDIRYVANSAVITSVTITYSATVNSNTAVLCEWSGMATSSPLDTSVNIQGSGFVTSLTSGAYTTTNAADVLMYSVVMTGSVSAPTAGASYTIPTNGTSGSRHSVQYRIVSSTQAAQTTSMSWTSSARASGAFAAFKAMATTAPTTASPFVISP